MRHMSSIRKMVDEGQIEEASHALTNLLEIGPNNLEALKLKAELLEAEGRFKEEEQLWRKIIALEPEDNDGLMYLERKLIEDRELYYFTDDLPGGGRRFEAYPRNLITMALIGLICCTAFLTLSRLGEAFPMVKQPIVFLSAFFFLVLMPWLVLVYNYFRSLKTITVHKSGIVLSTRLRQFTFNWNELRGIAVAHHHDASKPSLELLLIPENSEREKISVNLELDTTHIRARSYFLEELERIYLNIEYRSRKPDDLVGRVRRF